MQEDLLHFLWMTRRFDQTGLHTTQGEPVEILDPGQHNLDAGADFSQARLRLGGTIWVGTVEMHCRSSDWMRHGHQCDRSYSNVILHVVYEEDVFVQRPDGTRIPCLEMRDRISPRLAAQYQRLRQQAAWIPCQSMWDEVSPSTFRQWLGRLGIERLERKVSDMEAVWMANGRHWEETFYQSIARGLGLTVNADPFTALARSLPLRHILWHIDRPLQVEAMLFGQAGLLSEPIPGDYPTQLRHEYRFLQRKYGLIPIDPVMWKFLRLHPSNFPTVRIAQLAGLLCQQRRIFYQLLEVGDLADVEALFEVRLTGYWQTHYHFGRESPQRTKRLGKGSIHLLVSNVIAPMLYLYGLQQKDQSLQERAVSWLEAAMAERNAVTRGWERMGVVVRSAAETQALIHLKREYCERFRCLECAVGAALLRP
ncbi:MAG: hypothetical protein RLY31_1683 [Bacteroidota bacterium]|jgi:hypothetical protein